MAMRNGWGRTERLYRPAPIDSVARAFQEAVIVGEDNSFFTHGGIDYSSLRAVLGYRRPSFAWTSLRDVGELLPLLPRVWTRRAALRGASTITQQLAKNLYLSPSRNPLRKLKEAVTAYRLEAALDKRRIMELYVNVVELGDGVWGVEAASRKYFGVQAAGLSTEQAAALAATLPFPRRSNPLVHPSRMRWRQALILRRLEGEQVAVPTVDEEVDRLSGADTVFTGALDSLPPPVASDSIPDSGSTSPLDSIPPAPDSSP
jgi:monofunctional biosynthetic peptidoglycan transglycosylase